MKLLTIYFQKMKLNLVWSYVLGAKLKAALDELHSRGFAHNDVCLSNICFSDSCEPVFIDLDESSSTNDDVLALNSCMYRKPPGVQPSCGEQSSWT